MKRVFGCVVQGRITLLPFKELTMIGPHVQFELIHHSLHEFEINMFIFVSLSRYLFVLHFITKTEKLMLVTISPLAIESK